MDKLSKNSRTKQPLTDNDKVMADNIMIVEKEFGVRIDGCYPFLKFNYQCEWLDKYYKEQNSMINHGR